MELWKSEFRKRRRFFASARLVEGGRGGCGDEILVVPRQEFRIIGRVSRGYNFPTQFSFQSPPNESSLGWWVANGKGGEEEGGEEGEKEKELALMEGGRGRESSAAHIRALWHVPSRSQLN